MVRTSTVVAGLALAMTTWAIPMPQSEDIVAPVEPSTVDEVTQPVEPPAVVEEELPIAEPEVVVDEVQPPVNPEGTVDDLTPAADPESIVVEDTTPVEPQTDGGDDLNGEVGIPAVALEAQIESSQQAAENSACDLSPSDPSSYSSSGAEQMVNDYLKANGQKNWINGLNKQVTGLDQGLQCGHRNTGLCTPATLDANCGNQDIFIARYMAASIKSTFDAVGETLQDTGISGALDIKQIVEDFRLPDIPKGHDVGKTLNNVAFGVGVAEQAVGLVPGGEVVSSFLALVGIGLNAASENMEDEEPVVPEYDKIEAGMNTYLSKFFSKTREQLDGMLESLFGETKSESGTDDALLKSMLERMAKLGVKGRDVNSEQPVAEILAGGEWLKPIGRSGFKEAFDRGFKGMQGALIGNLLSGLQVYVEREENPPEAGPKSACTALGELMIDNECYIIKRKGFNGEEPKRLEDEYLEKLGEYKVDIHSLIRSTKDCDNGEANNDFTGTGEYGKCWYGLKIATRVSEELRTRYNPGFANGFACNAKYRNLDKIPSYIVDEKGNRCNGQWREVPVYKRCTINMFNDGSFNDRGLARYKMRLEGDGIDVGMVCPYLHDGRRCAFGSNRRCEKEADGRVVMEISFAHGSVGNDGFNTCHNDIYKQFKGDNHCFDKKDAPIDASFSVELPF